jgi:hypothetical protein
MPADRPDMETMTCPTCRAAQPWADACRRCRSDLRLLREAAAVYGRDRLACLAHLRAGRPRAALLAARRCHDLSPGPDSRRLLAVASLLADDRPAAVALARDAGREGPREVRP